MAASAQLTTALIGLGEALLIGLIIGAEREASQDERQAGVRDFLLIGLTGGICGLLQNPWLTVAALLAVAVLLAVFHFESRERTGITTEMAAVATFCLAYLTAAPDNPLGAPLAVGTAIVVVVFLEAKRSLHKFLREMVTEAEFNDTLRFLAIIFIIYPILPEGDFGPYQAFSPRKIWLFVILVSSISYVGYFSQKFLGARRGMAWTSVLGGLASTTAATLAFARGSAEQRDQLGTYWQAAVIANAIQFPRVLAILYVVNAELATASLVMLMGMTLAGLLMGLLLSRVGSRDQGKQPVPLGNPFRLLPALKFGLIFAAVMFASRMAVTEAGSGALYWTSAMAGTVDADAVAVSLAGLAGVGSFPVDAAVGALLLALLMNAVLKTALAAYVGGSGFGWRVGLGLLVMICTGAVAWGLTAGVLALPGS